MRVRDKERDGGRQRERQHPHSPVPSLTQLVGIMDMCVLR